MQTEPGSKFDSIPAAQYVRMSTEDQQYSIDNQIRAIASYAERHNMKIVRTYSDAGRSGLSTSGRNGILDLLADVRSGLASYRVVLVYDVSRWGRFQDTDESAYYEYTCKKANVQIRYCQEQFENDGSTLAYLIKSIKRSMAGEYSRELSAKVFAGQCYVTELGFRPGASAGYGLRRQLVSRDGTIKGLLAHGERKSIQSDRVILVPGPEKEIAVIREIYRQFTDDMKGESAITKWLNDQRIQAELREHWTRDVVADILTNPKYIGHSIYNRTSVKLKQNRVDNPPETWVVRMDAFAPVISKDVFAKAEYIRKNRRVATGERILEKCRALLIAHGRLSLSLIRKARIACPETIQRRFGTVERFYEIAGYQPKSCNFFERSRRYKELRSRACDLVNKGLEQNGVAVSNRLNNGLFTLENGYTVFVSIVPYSDNDGKSLWAVRTKLVSADLIVAARLARGNQDFRDYYVIPALECQLGLKINVECRTYRLYRFESLALFFSMMRPFQIGGIRDLIQSRTVPH